MKLVKKKKRVEDDGFVLLLFYVMCVLKEVCCFLLGIRDLEGWMWWFVCGGWIWLGVDFLGLLGKGLVLD